MTQCLRSLQRSNPSLLFSTSILQSFERDARYVPLLATALTSIVLGFESRSNASALRKIRAWKDRDASDSDSHSTGSSEADSEDGQETDTEEAIDESSRNADPWIEAPRLVSLAERQIRHRLEYTAGTTADTDADSASSNDQERVSKRPFLNLLDSSSEVDSVAPSEGSSAISDDVAGSPDMADDDEYSGLNDWL